MIKNLLFVLCCALMGYAQTLEEQTVLNEAKKRNITTVDQALAALKENGISESQARTLAREKGISFDAFLRNNFNTAPVNPALSTTTADPDTSVLTLQEPTQKTETRLDTLTVSANQEVSYFGYSIFAKNPFLEKEYLLGNIDEGYLVSPGDALRIIVFGNNSLELEAVVDRNGNINIPNYGVFFAAGNTFKTLRGRLKTYLGKYFSGLLTSPQNTFLDVSLTQLTPTKVVVMGQVNSPGPQILTTQANPLAALYAAGGVKTTGSLRDIRVYRNNKRIKTIDLYDYIVTGNLAKDITLTNNDVVFVPPRMSTVVLSGEVKTAGLYELIPGEKLSDLIDYSGGLAVNAATDRVNVQRTVPEEATANTLDKTLLTVNLAQLNAQKKQFTLYDGDKVTFFPLLDEVANQVTIAGNVYSPGTYSLNQYNDLKSLIEKAARGIKEDTYLQKVDVKGVLLPSGMETFASYNLAEILSDSVKVILNDRDEVYVYAQQEIEGNKLVYIDGYGVKSTAPVVWRKNLSIYDLVFENTSFESVDFRQNLFESRIDVKSYDHNAKKYVTTPYDFQDVTLLKTTLLKPYDRVVVYNRDVTAASSEEITVSGYVNAPGSYLLEKDMYVEDAILLAGGFSDPADQKTVYLNREELDPDTDISSIRYTITIDENYLNGKSETPKVRFVLQKNDIITIRKDRAFEPQQRIVVEGEVLYPRPVVATSERVSLSEILEEVGGLTDLAYLKSSYVLRDNNVLAVSLDRVNKNTPMFMDGDKLVISKNYGNVTTVGALENPSIFNWTKGKRAKYYLKNSGGKLDKLGGKAFVVLNNGKTRPVGFFNNPKVFPDSKIVVNYKAAKEKQEGKFLNDATNILGTLTGALTTILLIERL